MPATKGLNAPSWMVSSRVCSSHFSKTGSQGKLSIPPNTDKPASTINGTVIMGGLSLACSEAGLRDLPKKTIKIWRVI